MFTLNNDINQKKKSFSRSLNVNELLRCFVSGYKIHLSDSTHELLEKIGGFSFEHRGEIAVKVMVTMATD